jgi:hypothetical protein
LFARYVDGAALLADCPSHAEAGGERALQAADVVAEAVRAHRLDLPASRAAG